MEGILVNASWLASVILVLVGICKQPFSKFKTKHPKLYKATFFLLSLVLVIAGCVIVELYMLRSELLTFAFAELFVSTGFLVFGGYSAYECTGLKAGFKKLFELIMAKINSYSDSKLSKIIKKVGIEKLVSLSEKNATVEITEPIASEEPIKSEEVEKPQTIIITNNNNNL